MSSGVAIGVEVSAAGAVLVVANASAVVLDARRVLVAPTPDLVADAAAVLAGRARDVPLAIALTGRHPAFVDSDWQQAIATRCPAQRQAWADGGVASLAASLADGVGDVRGGTTALIAVGHHIRGAIATPSGALEAIDIAHLQVQRRGLPCDCGARGCLGTVAGLAALARWELLAQVPPERALADLWSPPALLGLNLRTRHGDMIAVAIAARLACRLASAFAAMAPPGEALRYLLAWPDLRPDDALAILVRRRLAHLQPQATLVPCPLATDSAAAGAAALALRGGTRHARQQGYAALG